ncbi:MULTISPECIES: WecB/TagA/CpsF family glycosyltransferase [Corynebacterium]|uniref:WecB/TagA/CpsF family glycosyltransferase n=1 Tax=Corynebacterium TaxID=1716 RepID=UPI00124E1DD2|nr:MULTISPECIES: WecB/TagA/CpsF family glycosyltransferase [Corynebacterium]
MTILRRLWERIPRVAVDKRSEHSPSINGIAVFRGDLAAATTMLLDATRPSHPLLAITPNVDQLNRLITDEHWREEFGSADALFVDGAPLLALFRLLKAQDVHRVTGADLLPAVAAAAATQDRTIAVLGGRDDIREAAVRQLRADNPGASIHGVSIPFSEDLAADPATIATLRELQPDVSFVCLGSPKQERWVLANIEQLPAGWYVGAGAAVDFVAGTTQRAPELLQKLGLEWAYRLSQEPRRLAKRYLVVGPLFLVVIARALVQSARKNS